MIRFRVGASRQQQTLASRPFHQYVLDDDTVWTEFHRTDDQYLLRFPKLADFSVSKDGKRVIAYPVAGTDRSTIEHLYLNQLVPLALSRQGRPAFHASVVSLPCGAAAFLGKTGMGKSTLAASFALDGAEFLTDDALLIDETDGIRALASHASLRLWEDSVAALIPDDIQMASAISYSKKARLLAGNALCHSEESEALLVAYVLESNDVDDIVIAELDGSEKHMAWVSNSFLLDIKDQDLLARHFDWTWRIAARIPTFRLDYPRDYGMLSRVREAIAAHSSNFGS